MHSATSFRLDSIYEEQAIRHHDGIAHQPELLPIQFDAALSRGQNFAYWSGAGGADSLLTILQEIQDYAKASKGEDNQHDSNQTRKHTAPPVRVRMVEGN